MHAVDLCACSYIRMTVNCRVVSAGELKSLYTVDHLVRNDNLSDVFQLIIYTYFFFCLINFIFQALGPEFVRMPDEQQIVLELPGSIVVNE